jgi:hypothetical protein
MTRSIDPIVSTDWSATQLRGGGPATRPAGAGPVIIDIRFAEE